MENLYRKVRKNEKGQMISNCPECGKEVLIMGIGQVAFCSLMCETNYRYRMKNKDLRGHESITPEEARRYH